MLVLWNFYIELERLPVLVRIEFELAFGDSIRVVGNFIIFLESPRLYRLDV